MQLIMKQQDFLNIGREFSALIKEETPLAGWSDVFNSLLPPDTAHVSPWESSRRWEFRKEAEMLWKLTTTDFVKKILLADYLSNVKGESAPKDDERASVIDQCWANKKIVFESEHASQLLELCVLQMLRCRNRCNNKVKRNRKVTVTQRMKLQFLHNSEEISEIVLQNQRAYNTALRHVQLLITKCVEAKHSDLKVYESTIAVLLEGTTSSNKHLPEFRQFNKLPDTYSTIQIA